MKYYAGIGSRETPTDVMEIMSSIASKLEKLGYILRSGGAKGADVAFEAGISHHGNKEIYLPWKKFNGSTSLLYLENMPARLPVAFTIAEKFYHSNLSRAPDNTQKYMTRNTFQILGLDFVNFSEFVICWTKDGKASGGTGQAIRVANHYNIPVFNLKNDIDRKLLSDKLLELKNANS